MKLKPLYGRVIVEPETAEEITKSGIVIPETADKEKPQQGKVVAVAAWRLEGDKKKPMQLKVGDKVLFPKFGGDEIKIKEKEYMVLKEEDILAIIK